MKKTWQAPQLVILTRSKPEEVVLETCKTVDLITTPGDFLDGCYFFANAVCAPCYDYGDS